MKLIRLFVCVVVLIVSCPSYSFGLTDLSDALFEDTAAGIEGELKDARFEFDAYEVLLLDTELNKNTHIIVVRHRGSVLLAGQASTEALRNKVQELILSVARLKWKEGDINNVEPVNAKICGKAARHIAGNERRKFNLKTADDCSAVNQLYNEVAVRSPLNEVQQSDDDLLRAIIVNKLIRASIIERAELVKVTVSDGQVYLLGNQLSETTAESMVEFVASIAGVIRVVPLFRF